MKCSECNSEVTASRASRGAITCSHHCAQVAKDRRYQAMKKVNGIQYQEVTTCPSCGETLVRQMKISLSRVAHEGECSNHACKVRRVRNSK